MTSDILSLFELNEQIKYSLYETFPETVWLIAEINELRTNRSGHCYLTLVEKDSDSEHLLAQSRAIVWSSAYRVIKPYFENSTGQPLEAGIKILVRVMVEFHEQYGLSLVIKDIEPSFTVGELEKQKQDIIRRLTEEGILTMNHGVELPRCPQRIAIISSATAAGLDDFLNQLNNNTFGYAFKTVLFQASLQGKEAESSITSALDSIYKQEKDFDMVAIIRGGGSQADLLCFNSYRVAYHIAQFPLPVITGIGHERDETTADIVAHTSLKTPTAVAEFLIDVLSEFEDDLENKCRLILSRADQKTQEKRNHMMKLAVRTSTRINAISQKQSLTINKLRHKTMGLTQKTIEIHLLSVKNQINLLRRNEIKNLSDAKNRQQHFCRELNYISKEKLTEEKHHVRQNAEILDKYNPKSAFSRGFTITYQDGKRISSINKVSKDNPVETLFADGILTSKPITKRDITKNDKN